VVPRAAVACEAMPTQEPRGAHPAPASPATQASPDSGRAAPWPLGLAQPDRRPRDWRTTPSQLMPRGAADVSLRSRRALTVPALWKATLLQLHHPSRPTV
jgi:hypothetical protein